MPKKMLQLEALKPCFVGEKHRYPGKPFPIEEDLFKDEKGKINIPKHLKKLGSTEISDAELKADADEKAKAEEAEKAELLQRAKDLGVSGAGAHWGLDTLKAKVEEAELALQGGNE